MIYCEPGITRYDGEDAQKLIDQAGVTGAFPIVEIKYLTDIAYGLLVCNIKFDDEHVLPAYGSVVSVECDHADALRHTLVGMADYLEREDADSD